MKKMLGNDAVSENIRTFAGKDNQYTARMKYLDPKADLSGLTAEEVQSLA